MTYVKAKTFVTDSNGYDHVVTLKGRFKDVDGDLILDPEWCYVSTATCSNSDNEYVEPSEESFLDFINLYDLDWVVMPK